MTDDSMQDSNEIVTKLSPRSVPETVARMTGMLDARGVKVFDVIDQSAEAKAAGLTLRETVLVIFGNPAAGTPVMDASPLAALDLPLKVLVWADGQQAKVSYYSPAALAARHQLSADLAAKLASIGPLTDALIAP
jgi:uncharacterized protein (DUF302 family)